MKRMNLTAIVMLAVFGANAFAVGFLGTPTAEIGAQKWTIGYDYSYSSQDTDKVTAKSTLGPFELKLRDFNLQRHYATLGYGISEDLDIYVKLGLADLKAKAKDYDTPDAWSMNFDTDFAWGWGMRYTFARQDNVSWGAAAQMNWLDSEFSKSIGADKGCYSFDSYDILLSAGPSVDMGGWKVYGGPFYYYLNGDYSYKYKSGGAVLYSENADIRADRNFGAFIGSVISLGQNCNWTVEYATTGDGWGVGTGIAWSF